MEYRMLGKTGLCVSAVGFGGIPIQRLDAQRTRTLMEALAAHGVNYIDTARGYTVSEEFLGQALQGGLRGSFILASKSMARTYEAMAADIETSLRNLRTDHIEIYQMHNLKPEEFELAFSPGGAAAAIQDAIRAGKVGHMGATAHSAAAFEKLLGCPQIETVMFPYNIVESQGEELIARAARQNVGFIAMKPMAGGNLTDGTLALRYILQNPGVTLAIPGMAEVSEVEENARAAEALSPLTQAEQEAIAGIRKELSGNFCRRCGYCAPCTAGIDIPSCFLFEGYLKRYDLAHWAKERYSGMKVKASACIGCGKCETRCPYELPIREKLRAVAAAFGE